MILSERFIGGELAYYRALKKRIVLAGQDAKSLAIQEKGFAGECEYDRVFDEAGHGSVFVFRDIYLRIDGKTAQYDCLIVSDDGIVVNEIKNYSGLYRYESGKWFIGKSEVSEDALSQLRRAIGRLVKMRYEVRGAFDISGKIIFPNIEFRLQSSDEELWNNIVMRAGLRNYLMQFKNMYAGRDAENIAEVIRQHIIPNPFLDKSADFDSLRKGLYCGDCGRFDLETNHFYMTCQKCGKTEKKETHVLRAISDYKSLFLNDKLTKQRFMEFIDYKVSERTVFRLLNKYCNQITKGKWTYYEFRYRDFDEAYQVHEILNRYKDKITNSN